MIRKTAIALSAAALCAVSTAPAFAGGPSTPNGTAPSSVVVSATTVSSLAVRFAASRTGGGRGGLGGGFATFYRVAAGVALGGVGGGDLATVLVDADGNPIDDN